MLRRVCPLLAQQASAQAASISAGGAAAVPQGGPKFQNEQNQKAPVSAKSTDVTLPYHFAVRKNFYGAKTIFRSRVERTDMSYKGLWDYAAQVGRGWIEVAGLKPGDKVLILCDTTVEPLILQLSTIFAGGEAIVLEPAGLDANALQQHIETIQPKYIVFKPQVQSPSPHSPSGSVTTDLVNIFHQVFPEYFYYQKLSKNVTTSRYPFVKQILTTVVPKQPDNQQAYGFLPARRLLKDSVRPRNYYEDLLRLNLENINADSPALSFFHNGKLRSFTHSDVSASALRWAKALGGENGAPGRDDRVTLTSGHTADAVGLATIWGCIFNGTPIGFANPQLINALDAEKQLKGVPAHRATVIAGDDADFDFIINHSGKVDEYTSRDDWSVERAVVFNTNSGNQKAIDSVKDAFRVKKVDVLDAAALWKI